DGERWRHWGGHNPRLGPSVRWELDVGPRAGWAAQRGHQSAVCRQRRTSLDRYAQRPGAPTYRWTHFELAISGRPTVDADQRDDDRPGGRTLALRLRSDLSMERWDPDEDCQHPFNRAQAGLGGLYGYAGQSVDRFCGRRSRRV